MTTKAADDMPTIAQRLKEIQAERWKHIQGTPIEPPSDVDWTKWNMFSVDAPD
jgi:hypothetical protein